jgi:hypothetical protein
MADYNDLPPSGNGWAEWSRFVLNTLKDQDRELKEVLQEIHKLQVSVEVLKNEMQLKSGVWGASASIVTILIIILVWYAQKLLIP